jgi:hypothetical protein
MDKYHLVRGVKCPWPFVFDMSISDDEKLERLMKTPAWLDQERIIYQYNGHSSPGYPLIAKARKNADFSSTERLEILRAVLARLRLLASVDVRSSNDPLEWVAANWVDPIMAVMKSEPHPRAKWSVGRFREIMMLSLVDQTLERMLWTYMHEEEIRSWKDSRSTHVGISFTDEANSLMLDKFSTYKRPVATDMSGWDYHVTYELLNAELSVRLAQVDVEGFRDIHEKIARNRLEVFSRSVILEGSSVIVQDRPGIQKTGSYLTSNGNSHMRSILAFLGGARQCAAVGDDCVEDTDKDLEGLKAHYAKYGQVCKDASDDRAHLTFCNRVYDLEVGVVQFDDESKMLCKLSHGSLTNNMLLSCFSEIRHNFEARVRLDDIVKDYNATRNEKLYTWLDCVSLTSVKIDPYDVLYEASDGPIEFGARVLSRHDESCKEQSSSNAAQRTESSSDQTRSADPGQVQSGKKARAKKKRRARVKGGEPGTGGSSDAGGATKQAPSSST